MAAMGVGKWSDAVKPRLIAILVVGSVVIGGAAAVPHLRSSGTKSPPASAKEDRRQQAWAAAKGFVRDSLRAPSTARFPELPPERTDGILDLSAILDPNGVSVSGPPVLSPQDHERLWTAEVLALPREEREQLRTAAIAAPAAQRRWRVEAWVDAQNGFGAMLRNRFTLTMLHNGAMRDWELESLTFEKR